MVLNEHHHGYPRCSRCSRRSRRSRRSLRITLLLLSLLSSFAQQPQLDGQHFRITVLQEKGFVDVTESSDDRGNVSREFSGFLVDLLEAVAQPERANFTYTLLTPSGYGSLCIPRLIPGQTGDEDDAAYSAVYKTQYNCGASDVNDLPVSNTTTDMYLGMYYVTPSRQLQNHFTIPFVPPFSGTLAMFGTATGIPNFESLVEQQQAGLQPAACAQSGTALIDFLEVSFPGIYIQGISGNEDAFVQALDDGVCEIFINDGPLASSFVLRREMEGECILNRKPVGTIGEPMDFGLSHYSIGIRRDIPMEIVDTISYWMNILMVCNPLDPSGGCTDGNIASFFEGRGGTGDECGYVLFPAAPVDAVSGWGIVGIVVGVVAFVALSLMLFHRYRMNRQERRFQKSQKFALEQARRERELNEFLAHEIRNPLSSAIAGLGFVSAAVDDPAIVPDESKRRSITDDARIVDSSLQFVNELLRNMLDIHRTASKHMNLDSTPVDLLGDVLEPVKSILFMRGNGKVKISAECPPNLIVNGDRMRLKQIILNLSANSSKFVQVGYIKLRAEVVENNVLLHVEDSGPGIPLQKRDILFQKFQESLDSLNQGTGIGLCVCKNLSELMGADIFLDEEFDSGVPGCVGTRFTLRLNQPPITRYHLTGSGDSARLSHAGDLSSCELKEELELPMNLSVLFVDDDTIIRKMFSRSLARVAPGWDVQEASNGETALRLTEEKSFDLIFMDQYMASVEKQLLGTETVLRLRAHGVHSLICGLSANDKEDEFLSAGANGFMLKPFPSKPSELRRELLKLVSVPKPEASCHLSTNV